MNRLRRLLLLGFLSAGVAGLFSTPAAAQGPWWHLSTSSRPTNLWLPASEVQQITRGGALTLIYLEGALVACMGGSECTTAYSLPDDETPAELQDSLEAAYGAGTVEVSEDPPAPGQLRIVSVGPDSGRWVPPLEAHWSESPGLNQAKILVEGGSGRLVVALTNIGDGPVDGSTSPVRITDRLPEGVVASHVIAFAGLIDYFGPVDCAVEAPNEIGCTFEGKLPSYEAIEIEIFASLLGEPPTSGAPGEVSVTGGGATAATAVQRVHVSAEETPFGIESYRADAEEEGGGPATHAGSHPFQLTTELHLNQGQWLPGSRYASMVQSELQPAQPRNLRFTLPAGLVGNATRAPRCSFADFTTHEAFTNLCPPESAIGAASVAVIERGLGMVRMAAPVFNLPPLKGEPARFGIMAAGVPVTLDTEVRSESGYRVVVHVDNTSQLAELLETTVSIWGNPGDPRHDSSRGWNCVAHEPNQGPCIPPTGLAETAFLRLPTSCEQPLGFPVELEPWNVPLGSEVASSAFSSGALEGCNQEPFAPTIDVRPDTQSESSPAGLEVRLRVPQDSSEVPQAISTSDVRSTTVRLPQALQLNPAGAQGLQACSEAQVGFRRLESNGEAVFDEAPAACPEASKLGTVEISSPLIDEPILGAVYQAAQGQGNPFGSLIALYVVGEALGAGIRVKLAGKVEPTATGLVSTFAETPQVPFEEFKLSFFGGSTAPLATSKCGPYVTETTIQPWSGAPAATPSSEFLVDSGQSGGPCRDPEPFNLSFSAGSEVPIAGSYSPFVLRLKRSDGSQGLQEIDTVLPPGMTGRLAGIPYCPEAAIAAAAARSEPGDGALEQAEPSCPQASRVASVKVAVGVGPDPYPVTGSAYLAGPYKGAPLSLAIVTPAIAGPFDLGAVVVRTALYVDPETTRITAKSDPLPVQLQGIPLGIRSVSLRMDRPEFTLNPTSCEPMAVTGTAVSLLGQSASLTSPFQIGACKALGFKPTLSLRFKGGTTRAKFPAVQATLKARNGDADIARTVVTLPPSEQIETAHIVNPCTRVQFNANECPPRTILGHATAVTPLLDEPLSGPVYFRSNGGARELPDVVADLRGQIHVVLVGYVDSVHGRVRTTFANVPDAPVSKFTLALFGGKKGLLVNNRNICARRYRAEVRMAAHNGRHYGARPVVKVRCGRRKTKR